MRTIPTLTAATLAAAATTLTLTATAYAADTTRTDPDDTAHGSDISSLKVANRERNLVVVTTHDDLRRTPSSGSGGMIYLDTDRDDRGPEYVLVGGWFEGTDYSLNETEGFGPGQWGEPVEGSYRVSIDYDRDRVRARISQSALGGPDEVRVSVRASGPNGDVDWVGKKMSYTSWLARG